MKKKIWNTTSFMFLLLIAACFLTHNDNYEQNINRFTIKTSIDLTSTTVKNGQH